MIEEYKKLKALLMTRTIKAAIEQKIKPTGLENPSYRIVKQYPDAYKNKQKKLVNLKYNTRKNKKKGRCKS